MILFVQGVFCLLLSLVSVSVAECLFHKYLFHKKISFISKFTKLWNYDPVQHTHHHKVCFDHIEDTEDPEEGYWVQRPSNVIVVGSFLYILELFLLWVIGFEWPFFIVSALFTIFMGTFWYKFEDHFHLAMHKTAYYKKNIEGTWQDSWFKYCKRLHEIHHKNFQYNYGFVFFPIGDIILGTFRNDFKKTSNNKETQE